MSTLLFYGRVPAVKYWKSANIWRSYGKITMAPFYTASQRGLSVCLSVCLLVAFVIPAKTAEPIEVPFGGWVGWSPRNHVLDRGAYPQKKGTVFRDCTPHWKVAFAAVYARTAKRSRYRLGANSPGPKEACIRWKSMSDESICRREGWQDGDAAFRQNSLTTC